METKEHIFKFCLSAAGTGILITVIWFWGCYDRATPPQPTITGLPDHGLVGQKLTASGSTGDSTNLRGSYFHWQVLEGEKLVWDKVQPQLDFTPSKSGKYVIRLSCRRRSKESSFASSSVIVETTKQRDGRLTRGMVGLWRTTTDEQLLFLDLHKGGKLNIRYQLLAGGLMDALAASAQNDMGQLEGDWWVQNGDLFLKVNGVENPLWNIWVRAVDAVTGGEFGKADRCQTKFEGDTMTLKAEFTEGKSQTFTRVSDTK